jgi:hypothetical protein
MRVQLHYMLASSVEKSLVETCINWHQVGNVFYWRFTAYLLIDALGIYPAGSLPNPEFDQNKRNSN